MFAATEFKAGACFWWIVSWIAAGITQVVAIEVISAMSDPRNATPRPIQFLLGHVSIQQTERYVGEAPYCGERQHQNRAYRDGLIRPQGRSDRPRDFSLLRILNVAEHHARPRLRFCTLVHGGSNGRKIRAVLKSTLMQRRAGCLRYFRETMIELGPKR